MASTGLGKRIVAMGTPALLAGALLAGCAEEEPVVGGPPAEPPAESQQEQENGWPASVETSEQDWEGVAEALGRQGEMRDGTVYRVSFPRDDLDVSAQGAAVDAELALDSYAAFARYPDDATLVTGTLVVTQEELPAVTDALQASGITQTAIHKHLLSQEPALWWAHFQAEGDDAVQIAQGLKTALDVTGTPPPPGSPAPVEEIDLDTAAINQVMGTEGSTDNGIYRFAFARADAVGINDYVVPAAMGARSTVNFQPTGNGEAAMTGELAVTADEIQAVIKALRAGGIDVLAIHHHAVNDQPRLFYLPFWANDDAVAVAHTLRQALDAHDVVAPG